MLQPVCTDFAKIRHFGNIVKVLDNYVRAYFVLGKKFNLLWSPFYDIGQIFIASNGLIVTNYATIWSLVQQLSDKRSSLLSYQRKVRSFKLKHSFSSL